MGMYKVLSDIVIEEGKLMELVGGSFSISFFFFAENLVTKADHY